MDFRTKDATLCIEMSNGEKELTILLHERVDQTGMSFMAVKLANVYDWVANSPSSKTSKSFKAILHFNMPSPEQLEKVLKVFME